MTANTQIPNEAGGAPVWQPMPPAAEPEPASAGELPSEEVPTSGGTVEFAPGYADKPRARAKNRRAGSTTALLMVGALVAVGGVGFALGHNLSAGSGGGNSAADGQNGFRANGSFNPGQFGPNASGAPERGFGGGGGSVTGTVESVTADSMTIKLASGQTVTLAIGSSTTYHSQTSADSSQVTAGSTVIVQTSGGSGTGAPGAAASAGMGSSAGTGSTTNNRTATDVTVTSK